LKKLILLQPDSLWSMVLIKMKPTFFGGSRKGQNEVRATFVRINFKPPLFIVWLYWLESGVWKKGRWGLRGRRRRRRRRRPRKRRRRWWWWWEGKRKRRG